MTAQQWLDTDAAFRTPILTADEIRQAQARRVERRVIQLSESRNTRTGAKPVRDLIVFLAKRGMSRSQIAETLNERGLRTVRGNLWHNTSVYTVLKTEGYPELGRELWKPGDPTPICRTHGEEKYVRVTANRRLWICRSCKNEYGRIWWHTQKQAAA